MTAGQMFQAGGFAGLAAIVVALVLTVVGVSGLVTGRGRTFFLIYVLAGLAPIVLGLVGTWLNQCEIQAAIRSSGTAPRPEELSLAYRRARTCTHIGLVAGIPELIVGGVGLLVIGRNGAAVRPPDLLSGGAASDAT